MQRSSRTHELPSVAAKLGCWRALTSLHRKGGCWNPTSSLPAHPEALQRATLGQPVQFQEVTEAGDGLEAAQWEDGLIKAPTIP